MSDSHDVGNSAAAVVIRDAHRPGFVGASLTFQPRRVWLAVCVIHRILLAI